MYAEAIVYIAFMGTNATGPGGKTHYWGTNEKDLTLDPSHISFHFQPTYRKALMHIWFKAIIAQLEIGSVFISPCS